MSNLSVAADSFDYYRQDVYWNSFPTVVAEINRRLSGDPGRDWVDRFNEVTDGRTFERALILCCGNGQFERKLLDQGTIRSAVGVDFKPELIDTARRVAADEGRPLEYRRMDVNTTAFADEDVDLVVNHAAAHHVRYLDRVLRAACRMLPEDGWLLSWDYVGPHRNQWPWAMWEAACELNRSLPPELRNQMVYPHGPTMLASDPTEAVHSELFAETVSRYFTPVEETGVGGGLAYLVLTHNEALWGAPPAERDRWATELMEADGAWLADGGETLFSFLAARPDHDALGDEEQLSRWTATEERREAEAEESGGEYYEPTLLQEMTLSLAEADVAVRHLRIELEEVTNELEEVTNELEELRSSTWQPLLRWGKRFLRRLLSAVPPVERGVRRLLRRPPDGHGTDPPGE